MDCCKGYEERIFDSVDNLLSTANKKALDDHLKSCTRCSKALRSSKLLRGHLKNLMAHKTSDDFETVLRTRIRLERSLHRRGILGRPIRIPMYAAAGVVAIAAFFVFGIANNGFQPGAVENPVPVLPSFANPNPTTNTSTRPVPNQVNFPIDWLNVSQGRTFINSEELNKVSSPGLDTVRSINAREVQF